MREKPYVYFIKPVGMDGPIKIGCSGIPEDRLIALTTWSPFKLEIIGRTPGTLKDEGFLHRCFSEFHSHHEWFYFTPALAETIKKILASSIDEVRSSLTPKKHIRRGRKLKSEWTDSERLKASFASKIRLANNRLRKIDEKGAWHEPKDVEAIMNRWHGRPHKKIVGIHPTEIEIARLQEFIDNPAVHSIIPSWRLPRDPICVPIFGLEDAA